MVIILPDQIDFSNLYNQLESEIDAQQSDATQGRNRKASVLRNTVVAVLRVSIVLLIGVIVLSAVNDTASKLENGGLTIKITQNPAPGETITFDGKIFEFNGGNGVLRGNIPITIGSTIPDTAQNMITVFNRYNYNAVIIY
jgi:hypothetical protein